MDITYCSLFIILTEENAFELDGGRTEDEREVVVVFRLDGGIKLAGSDSGTASPSIARYTKYIA